MSADVDNALDAGASGLAAPMLSRLAVWLPRIRRFLPVAAALIFAGAIWLLERELADKHLADALIYLNRLPQKNLALAGLFTLASYAALVAIDFLAVRYAGGQVSPWTVVKTSFMAGALTHNLGFGTLTGGSVRYRFYSSAGLSGLQITTAIAFHALTFPLSASFLGGLSLLVEPQSLMALVPIPEMLVRLIGALLALPVPALLALSAFRARHLKLGRWRIQVPTLGLTLGQVLIGILDLVLAAATLYILLPLGDSGFSFLAFLSAYVTAVVVSVISHVPGGLGVFEGLIISFTAETLTAHEVLGALLAYRLIYYIVPLVLATGWFGIGEYAARRRHLSAVAQIASKQWTLIAPAISAAAVFLAGAILVISGAAPERRRALRTVNDWLPLGLIEGSHLIASVAGVGLLLLSGALLQRVDTAYYTTLALLAVGAVTSVAKGNHYQEALVLVAIGLALWPARSAFYRHGALLQLELSRQWLLAAAAVIAGSVWIGFFAHRYVEYDSELWWQFELNGNAPRFLRASLLVTLLFTAAGIRQLLRSRSEAPALPTPAEMDKIAEVVGKSLDSSANLALVGDKAVLFNDSGDGFIMYRVHGGTWLAMGDPVAPHSKQIELLWKFRELSDQFGGKCAFYQVKPENLGAYADLGLALYKLGDEARVDLSTFSLDSSARRDLRQTHKRAVREGAVFKMLSPQEVVAAMPRLWRVSSEWLKHKAGKEKGFSLGYFDERYLAASPCGVVMVNGEIVAFANLWQSAQRAELSVDLMRHTDTPVHGVMDFLLVEIMLWGKAQGYVWFNLGMAPLSGLEGRHLGPLWHKLGGLLYRIGDQFYSFRGLRKYKEKFGPEWRPKYLACPGGLALGRVLLDVTATISGGTKAAQSPFA